jgi:hypothetical protein
MQTFKDYYFILGITKTASQADIERAYEYSLGVLKSCNYDEIPSGGSLQRSLLDDIREAYACLRNPTTRHLYDDRLDAAAPPPAPPQRIAPMVRNNSRETIELTFAAMKKKKSSSFSALERFLRAMILLACVSVSALLGFNYFKTGGFGFPNELGAMPVKLANSLVTRESPREAAPPRNAPSRLARRASPPGANDQKLYVKVYDIRYGGVITAQQVVCRKDPSPSAAATVRMYNDTVVFVTKESSDGDGTTWYFVENKNGSGWVSANEIKVYK